MKNAFLRTRRTPAAAAPKVPRDRLVRINVEADDCPQALHHVLGFVAQHGRAALGIYAERSEHGQRISVDIDTVQEHVASKLLGKIGAMSAVKHVILAAPDRPQ